MVPLGLMAVLDIKGVRIGEGRTKTIVSMMAKSPQDLANEQAKVSDSAADIIEWRADYYEYAVVSEAYAGTCFALSEAIDKPLIFTLRTVEQGGKAEVGVEDYYAVLEAVIRSGEPDLVDIELWIGAERVQRLVQLAHENGVRVIVSHHDFEKMPSEQEMVNILLVEAELGADIPKLAAMAKTTQETHSLMRATSLAREKLDVPLLTMAMGTAGINSRLSGEVFGSAMTFCALGMASAPGQVELSQALPIIEAIHRTVQAG
jgi:3-dehydroquinate dehydratase-1